MVWLSHAPAGLAGAMEYIIPLVKPDTIPHVALHHHAGDEDYGMHVISSIDIMETSGLVMCTYTSRDLGMV